MKFQHKVTFIVDAFTKGPFSGNPAAVCVLDHPVEDRWMQSLATEMNLSETAFVQPLEHGFSLRWFTPKLEVQLCGHATLAAAHVIWNELGVAPSREELRFATLGGPLSAACKPGGEIELDFPALEYQVIQSPRGLDQILGFAPYRVAQAGHRLLVELSCARQVKEFHPVHEVIAAMDHRALLLTSRSDESRYDIVSRYFAPRAGVPEDAVTGSAHCVLGPYWKMRLGKDKIMAFQASERGGEVKVRTVEDRVFLAGRAITVLKGHLTL